MKRPLGVSLIGYFYIFGAVILLFTSIFYDSNANQIGLVTRFGLADIPERLFRVLVALISIVMVYGYMRLEMWGLRLMIGYSILFGVISLTLFFLHNQQPFIGNVIWSIIVLIYSIYVEPSFKMKQQGIPNDSTK
ncbi:hypothetical protein P4646_22710 [Peribacillus simplex]|uniref:hypothetical protein n=1 Tax=Peribacillus simplex TaxID=1478 RepID=UPI002E1D6324|nr:hypothetical protein [Peribacillus simplex]MED4094770.1 hypothetical protein [Peribacillus simplex]